MKPPLDYEESDDDPTGLNFFRGLVDGLAITGLFIVVFVGFAVITGV